MSNEYICCGLQIADLVAHPIGRYYLNSNQENRSFAILEKKFLEKNGRKEGYGLKIFPSDPIKQKTPVFTEV